MLNYWKVLMKLKILIKEDRYINDSFKDFDKDYPDKSEKLEETLLIYMEENDLQNLKTELPDKLKFLTKKLAYSQDYFNSIGDYRKPDDIFRTEDFFSKLKIENPGDEAIKNTTKFI